MALLKPGPFVAPFLLYHIGSNGIPVVDGQTALGIDQVLGIS